MQEGWQDAIERVDERVAALIGSALLASAYEEAIRRLPATEAGFSKLRDKHRMRVAALAAEISADVRRAGAASAGA